ncbi:MAG: hypothetical protein DRO40_06145 [Thermoprotei archaeon]|nr:MAG: hypothetical protein DRO40_06145 [Thermoprotei archaeon]
MVHPILVDISYKYLVDYVLARFSGSKGGRFRELIKKIADGTINSIEINSYYKELKELVDPGLIETEPYQLTEIGEKVLLALDSIMNLNPRILNGLERNTQVKIMILESLLKEGIQTLADLQRILPISRPTLNKYVEELANMGLVRRNPNKKVILLDDGRKLLSLIYQSASEIATVLVKKMSVPGIYVVKRGSIRPERLSRQDIILKVTSKGEIIPIL